MVLLYSTLFGWLAWRRFAPGSLQCNNYLGEGLVLTHSQVMSCSPRKQVLENNKRWDSIDIVLAMCLADGTLSQTFC